MEAAALSQLAVTVELDVSHTLVRLVTSTANLSPDDCRVGDVGFINSTVVSVFRYPPVLKPSNNFFLIKGIIYAET